MVIAIIVLPTWMTTTNQGSRVTDNADMAARIEKALDYVGQYGYIDGEHHKQWVLDQMVRALTGCPMVEKSAIGCDGKPYTYEAQGESEEYRTWLNPDPDYSPWDEGVAP